MIEPIKLGKCNRCERAACGTIGTMPEGGLLDIPEPVCGKCYQLIFGWNPEEIRISVVEAERGEE